MRDSTLRSPGRIVNGTEDAGNARDDHRGASMASCTFIPKSITLMQRLHRPHDLIVAARAAGDHVRPAVFHHERALQCGSRPFAGLQRIRFAGLEGEVVGAAIEEDAEPGHHDARAPRAVDARLEADHVAVLVDDGQIARVA